jgi:hypothetical protein
MIYDRDLKAEGVFWASNLNRSIWHRRPGRLLLPWFSSSQEQSTSTMVVSNGWAQARAMGHELKQGLFLHDLEENRVSFYSLSAEKKIHRRLAAAAWFGRLLVTVSGSFDDPRTTRTKQTYSSCSPLAPLCFNCFGWQRIELVPWLPLCARIRSMWDKIWRAWAAIYRASCTES